MYGQTPWIGLKPDLTFFYRQHELTSSAIELLDDEEILNVLLIIVLNEI
jgi:hypothetical protein